MRSLLTSGALLALLALAGCESAAAPVDAGRDAGPVPAESCGQPGDEGNSIGVGRFCTRSGGECAVNSGARLCVADLAPDQMQWFCSRLCTTDADCGESAVCVGDSRGSGCTPAECAPEPEDGGMPMSDAGAADGG